MAKLQSTGRTVDSPTAITKVPALLDLTSTTTFCIFFKPTGNGKPLCLTGQPGQTVVGGVLRIPALPRLWSVSSQFWSLVAQNCAIYTSEGC